MIVSPGVYTPRLQSISAGTGVVAVDSSGSVSDTELAEFISEMTSIFTLAKPKKLYVVWCDAAIDRVDEFEDPEELVNMVRATGVGGRGGTSFVPPFQWLRDEHIDPDFMIYMTDGFGPFPEEDMLPYCGCIWLINNDSVTPPNGEHIVLE
jgi:predicted metal-dependent peptidase